MLLVPLLALGLTLASTLLPAAYFARAMRPGRAVHYPEGGKTPLAWFTPPPADTSAPYGSITTSSIGYSETILTTSGMRGSGIGDSGPLAYTQCRTSVGFPFTVLRHVEQETDPAQTVLSQHPFLGSTISISPDFITVSHLAPRGTLLNSALRFPRTIFVPGLIANCIFLSATLVVLQRLLRHVLHTRRRSRGLCTRCGFELAQLSRCPECGTPCPPPLTEPLPSDCTT
jgi:hypothetical protein